MEHLGYIDVIRLIILFIPSQALLFNVFVPSVDEFRVTGKLWIVWEDFEVRLQLLWISKAPKKFPCILSIVEALTRVLIYD